MESDLVSPREMHSLVVRVWRMLGWLLLPPMSKRTDSHSIDCSISTDQTLPVILCTRHTTLLSPPTNTCQAFLRFRLRLLSATPFYFVACPFLFLVHVFLRTAMDAKREPITEQEQESLLPSEPEPEERLRGHKRECAIAIMLCFGAGIGDLLRWCLLLVFRDRMWAFYYENRRLRGIIIGSITWDIVCFGICAGIYNLHKQWIRIPDYRRDSRFNILYLAIVTRLFMFIPMIFGCVGSSRPFQEFVFIVQILYYFLIVLAWIQPTMAYIGALMYSELMPVPSQTVREMEQVNIHPIPPKTEIQMPRTPRPQPIPIPIPSTLITPLQQQTQQEKQPLLPPVSLYDSEVDVSAVQPAYLTPPSTESQFL